MSRPYVELIRPDDLDATAAAAAGLLEHDSRIVGFENRYATKGGDWRWLLWSSYSDGLQLYAVVPGQERRPRPDRDRALGAGRRL